MSGSDNIIPVIFSVRSIGHLTGSVVCGILYDKYRNQRYAMLAASIVIAALGERMCSCNVNVCVHVCSHMLFFVGAVCTRGCHVGTHCREICNRGQSLDWPKFHFDL